MQSLLRQLRRTLLEKQPLVLFPTFSFSFLMDFSLHGTQTADELLAQKYTRPKVAIMQIVAVEACPLMANETAMMLT